MLAAQNHGIEISNEYAEKGIIVVSPEWCDQAVNDLTKFFTELMNDAGFQRKAIEDDNGT